MFWVLLRPRWAEVLVLLATIIAGSALELVQPFLLRRIVDHHLKVGTAEGLGVLALLYILAFVAVSGVGFAQTYVAASLGQNALKDLKVRLFRHMCELPISYFDRNPTGDAVSRCTSDVEAVGTLFSSTILGVFSQIVRLGGVVAAMVVLSPRLMLVALTVLPVVVGVSRFFRSRMLSAEREVRRKVGETNSYLQEVLRGMEVVRAFGGEGRTKERFRKVQDGFLRAADRSSLYDSLFSPLVETVRAASVALLLWYGTKPSVFLSWGITLGTLVAFVQLLDRFFGPITSLGQEYQTVQRAVAGAERILEVLELPAEERPPAHPVAVRPAPPEVRLEGVVFGYVPGRPVLKGVDLAVEPGEHLAIVGPTGAGKSSLVHLIAGLYAPEVGTVRVGGMDPRSLAPGLRRRLVGVVPQQVHMFDGTVLDNLLLGEGDVSLDEVWEALELAGAADFVAELPDGLYTHVGPSGLKLSSGQRQLLALARALVGDPKLLLLDEATSSVDSETERAVREGLVRSGSGRTVVTVAHRLSSVQDADRVVVMVDGRIAEEGRPEELEAAGGWYAGMLELQRLGWEDRRRAEQV